MLDDLLNDLELDENSLDIALPTEADNERLDFMNDLLNFTTPEENREVKPLPDNNNAVLLATQLNTAHTSLTAKRKLTLRPYQEEGVQFLLEHQKAAIHDEWGLGKTAQAAEAAHRVRLFNKTDRGNGRCLVVAPGYLTVQWAKYLGEQYPETTVIVASSDASSSSLPSNVEVVKIDKMSKSEMIVNSTVLGHKDWVIVNKEMVRVYVIPPLFDSVIIDEAHHFRNRTANMSKAMDKIAQLVPYVFQLTATPIEREPDDLYWQMHMLDPITFSSYERFCYEYCHVVNTGYGMGVRGGYTGKIQRMLENYALVRKYRQVHMYLPRLIENVVTVPMSPELRKRYDGIRYLYVDILAEKDQTKFYSAAIQVMQKLRQITMCDEKLNAIAELVEDVSINQDVVIFCWYKEAAKRIAGRLAASKSPHVRESIIPVITGDMSPTDRVRHAKNAHILVATLSSLSEGVDLSHAKHVIFAECFYTHGKMAQALARVRRWTENEGSVHSHYVHMSNSIDEIIFNVQKDRGMTVRDIMKAALE